MTTAWWTGLTPAEVEIPCGTATHELQWAEGVLSAPSHPDAERERALIALGGEPAPCLTVLDGWLRHSADLDVLLYASRGPGDEIAPVTHDPNGGGFWGSPARGRPGMQQGWTMYAPMSSRLVLHGADEETSGSDLERLLRLGGGLPHRLAATVIGEWSRRIEDGDARVPAAQPRLQAALYGRLMHTIRSWRGSSAHISLVMAAPGTEPAITRAGELIQITLPFSWLRDVWARGIATTFGRLCLSASHQAGTWHLVVADLVDHDLGRTQLMTISLS